jgi:hypothetical protein
VIKRCLAKDPSERWQSAGDLGVGLNWLVDKTATVSLSGLEPLPKPNRTRKLRSAVTAVLALTTIVLAALAVLLSRKPDAEVVRFAISSPDKMTFDSGALSFTSFNYGSISPNGRKIAFTNRDEAGKVMLWVRSLNTLIAQPLQGTETAALPFWSPDGRSIGFSAQGQLKKISVDGGLLFDSATLPTSAAGPGVGMM